MAHNNINTISAPGFDNFNGNNPVPTEEFSTSVSGTVSLQNIIFDSWWSTFFGFSLVVSLIFLVGIVYSMMRLQQIRKKEKEYFDSVPPSSVARKVFGIEGVGVSESEYNTRWREIISHVNSDNSNDWRQAILDADVMLDTAITNRGYTGDGVGEKMKKVHRGDINTIDDAWEAHKVRNKIAHEGSNLELNRREARRVIGLYENVFRELGYI